VNYACTGFPKTDTVFFRSAFQKVVNFFILIILKVTIIGSGIKLLNTTQYYDNLTNKYVLLNKLEKIFKEEWRTEEELLLRGTK